MPFLPPLPQGPFPQQPPPAILFSNVWEHWRHDYVSCHPPQLINGLMNQSTQTQGALVTDEGVCDGPPGREQRPIPWMTHMSCAWGDNLSYLGHT